MTISEINNVILTAASAHTLEAALLTNDKKMQAEHENCAAALKMAAVLIEACRMTTDSKIQALIAYYKDNQSSIWSA